MAHFVKPDGIGSEGYDIDNKLAPGSLWRVRIPVGGTRLVGLCLGTGLKVTSNNPAVVPNDRLREVSAKGDLRTFEVFGKSAGGSWLDVWGADGAFWIRLQTMVDDPANFTSDVKPKTKIETNLGLSMQAVRYVLKTVGLKAANYDKYRGQPSYEKGTAKKNDTDICVYDKTRPEAEAEFATTPSATKLDLLRIRANHAKADKCGNCGENSDVAFIFLYDMGVRPVEIVEHSHDHAFVVIGRTAGDINDTSTWGSAAAICDPWMEGLRGGSTFGSYTVAKLEEVQRIKARKLTLTSYYREA